MLVALGEAGDLVCQAGGEPSTDEQIFMLFPCDGVRRPQAGMCIRLANTHRYVYTMMIYSRVDTLGT